MQQLFETKEKKEQKIYTHLHTQPCFFLLLVFFLNIFVHLANCVHTIIAP